MEAIYIPLSINQSKKVASNTLSNKFLTMGGNLLETDEIEWVSLPIESHDFKIVNKCWLTVNKLF